MNALNLPLSPEKMEFWECADLVDVSAGETGIAIQTSDIRPPGVSDSIELHNDRQVTRRATIKAPLGNQPQWQYPSTTANVKRGCGMATSQVMGTGEPQWPSEEAANPR